MDAVASNKEQRIEMHVMIDLETLGLKPGCKILSIGARVFTLAAVVQCNAASVHKYFYDRASLVDQGHLTTLQSTYDWWMEQSDEARSEAFGGVVLLEVVLEKFASYLRALSLLGEVHVWGNSASFDLKILEAAYESYGMAVPWDFRNEECCRTLKNRFKGLVPMEPFNGTKHNALHDAVHQATHCEKILEYIENARLCGFGDSGDGEERYV